MKPFYILLLTIVAAGAASAQGTYTWNGLNGASWTTAANWMPARNTPNANDTLLFSAGNTRSIIGVPTQTVGRIRVFNNTNITLSGATGTITLTINNNADDDLIITSGSLTQNATIDNLVLAAGATADVSGTFTNLGAFNMSAAGAAVTVKGNFDNRIALTGASASNLVIDGDGNFLYGIAGGTVPTATWNTGSTLTITGATTAIPGGLAQAYTNFAWDCGAQSADLVFASNLAIPGDFTVAETNGNNLILTDNTTSRTLSVGGNYIQTGGVFRATNSSSGNATMTVAGNFNISGGEFRGNNSSGVCSVTITGNLNVSGTGLVNLLSGTAASSMTVTGNVNITGGTLRLTEGTNINGTLNVTGNYTHSGGTVSESGGGSSAGVIVFNGTGVQTFTSGGTVTNAVNYTVNSGATLQMAAAGTIVSGNIFTLSNGATLGIRSAVGITATGGGASGNIQTATRTFNTGANYLYNGTVNQTTLGTGFPNNITGSLTIDNAANVTMTVARTIANGGTVYLTSGAFATATNLTMASTSTISRSGGTLTGTLQGTGLYNAVFTGLSKTTGPELGGTGLSGLTVNLNANQVLTLDQARTIAGTLTLTNGLLTTTPTFLLTIGTGGSATAGSSTSFVNGPLAKNTNTTAAFTFPVGTTTGGLRPIGIAPTNTNATTYTARFFSSSPKTAYAGAGFGAGIGQISACEYWTLDRSLAGTPAPATVTLSWSPATCSGAGFVGNPLTLRVARHDGGTPGAWQDAGYTGSTPASAPYTSGTVTSAAVNNFSPFTIGTTNANQNPLPVMFADVKAYAQNDGVQIEWSNLTEREIIGYVVERSTNGTTFSELKQVAPRSNNDGKESYNHFDASPVTGSNFYRIRVNEMHGKIIYSKVLRVDIGSSKQSFGLYPNPVTGRQFTVSLNGMKPGQYSLKVINATGQPVFETKIVNQSSATTQTLELPASVKSGVYTTVLTGADYRESKLFIVQ